MPKRKAEGDDLPRPRRSVEAIAHHSDGERGLAMRLLLHSPKDLVAGTLAFAAVGAIVTNALFLQTGPHPSPMFGSVVTMPLPSSSPLPRPRPSEAAVRPVETVPAEPKPVSPKTPDAKALETRASEPRAPETRASDLKASDIKAADPMANLVKETSMPTAAPKVLRPPASIPLASRNAGGLSPGGSRRVAAIQRTLTEYGYGQLKPNGLIGSDTQAAIQRFEREHKIPANGQVSERLVRELSAAVGHSID